MKHGAIAEAAPTHVERRLDGTMISQGPCCLPKITSRDHHMW